jgi:DNA-binding response OmpR family regulator
VVVVVDDDAILRDLLVQALHTEGHDASAFPDGDALLRSLTGHAGHRPDLVILDVNLPGLDGYEVCRRMRSLHPGVPVLMLSVRRTVPDRVAGLDVGADDYLTKPFDLTELLARTRALLRRTHTSNSLRPGTDEHDAEPGRIESGDLTIDTVERVVERRGRRISLTKVEYDLLLTLVERPRTVVPKDVLYARIWQIDFATSSRALDVHISNLRAKTEFDGAPRLVHTERAIGYVYRPVDPTGLDDPHRGMSDPEAETTP